MTYTTVYLVGHDSIPKEQTCDSNLWLFPISGMYQHPLKWQFNWKGTNTIIFGKEKIDQIALFHELHDKIVPLVRRKRGITDENTVIKGFRTTANKMELGWKLCSSD